MSPARCEIAGVGRRLRNGALSCEALTRACLDGIHLLDPVIRAFITVCDQAALDAARARDRELAAGHDRGALHGIPIVYKDNIDVAGIRSTVGSKLFEDRVPEVDAEIVSRLERAGTVTLGKTNMNEFAAGGPGGFNKFFGSTRNPWNVECESGGSSSGSGAAVAAGLCFGAIGSDSGGSIRGPASHMGIVGLRPTAGRVSNKGVFPRAPTLDTCGPLARTVADAALLLGPLLEEDVLGAARTHASQRGAGTFRIGVITGYGADDVEPGVAAAFGEVLTTFRRLGATIVEVDFPDIQSGRIAAVAADLLMYEFKQVFGKTYDSITDPELVGPVVHSDMAKAADLGVARYREAIRLRQTLSAQIENVFSKVDALAMPTMPTSAPLIGRPDLSGRHRKFTIPFSFAGQPALSVPCGFSVSGLPLGLQLVGAKFREADLVEIALVYEDANQAQPKRPPYYVAIAGQ